MDNPPSPPNYPGGGFGGGLAEDIDDNDDGNLARPPSPVSSTHVVISQSIHSLALFDHGFRSTMVLLMLAALPIVTNREIRQPNRRITTPILRSMKMDRFVYLISNCQPQLCRIPSISCVHLRMQHTRTDLLTLTSLTAYETLPNNYPRSKRIHA